MENRWLILFVLFFARVNMAFQYQSVAALSPFITDKYSASLADIGLLIGMYLGPGVIVAIPGGTLAARFGDNRVVGLSLVAMLAGGLMMTLGDSWSLLLTGRVLAGIGGVIVNIVMTKMVVDWFAGREIGTAMGIFISSWPLGISLALLSLPSLAASGGLIWGWLGVMGSIAVALGLFLAVYRPAPERGVAAVKVAVRHFPVTPLALAAAIWALYNTALAMVFSFGSLILAEQGLEPPAASSVVSLFTLMLGVAVPVGGYLSDRLGRDVVILASLILSVVSLPVLLSLPIAVLNVTYALAGFLMGLSAGPIMTLPSQVLKPETRAFGMGVFFAIYYAVMMVGPAIGGTIADRTGTTGAAFVLGSGLLVMCIVALLIFQRRAASAAV